jgi:hypothetical protein
MCRALISLLRCAIISLLCRVVISFSCHSPSRPFIGEEQTSNLLRQGPRTPVDLREDQYGLSPPSRLRERESRGARVTPQFDRSRGPQVSVAIPNVLEIFGDRLSDWAIAAWFIAGNGYLDGESPKNLVEKNPNRVIAAAQDEMNEVSHG